MARRADDVRAAHVWVWGGRVLAIGLAAFCLYPFALGLRAVLLSPNVGVGAVLLLAITGVLCAALIGIAVWLLFRRNRDALNILRTQRQRYEASQCDVTLVADDAVLGLDPTRPFIATIKLRRDGFRRAELLQIPDHWFSFLAGRDLRHPISVRLAQVDASGGVARFDHMMQGGVPSPSPISPKTAWYAVDARYLLLAAEPFSITRERQAGLRAPIQSEPKMAILATLLVGGLLGGFFCGWPRTVLRCPGWRVSCRYGLRFQCRLLPCRCWPRPSCGGSVPH